ncbi:protein translocase subunit SecF [Moraxella lacunata]|uniref:protein translocase subunit SecF n=1 Tax=Moraxella lacunata TaxID=477 RepID=UPI0024816DD5|nr:protein translocase subunit SecF [Moraxella lacunata]MDH9218910.1 protein translocase subunit SecF [Moraxella lacunata]
MTDNNDNLNTTGETRRRRAPRRDGKGSNAAANASLDNQAIIAQTDEFAEKEGGVKLLGNKRIIPFMKLEIPMVVLSAILVIASLVAITKGLNLGLDFTGGISADVAYSQPVEQAQVASALADKGFNDAVVQYLGTRQELLIRLPPQENKDPEGLSDALSDALNLPANPAKVDNVNIIGSQVGKEVYTQSLMALGLALILMMVYISIRFQFKLAVGATLALFHDVIVVCGLFAIFGWPFDLTVLASVLALIGYSVNDTIVVYDRIRENFRRVRGLLPRQVIDLSLTETLRRTCMTSGTVFVVVLALLFLGGEGLFWFALAQFIGTIAGTYSSVYVASSIPLRMGLSREDFVVRVKPEFEEEVVVFADPKLQNAQD